MANTILIKRSATPGKVPSIANLSLGELGINTYDGSLYFKKDDGVESIVTVSIVGKTEIFTNKTFNTAGITGNVFQINGTTISAISGTGSTVVLSTGPSISNLTLTGTLTAGGSAGTSGQVLQSTATGVQWTAPTPLATITNDTTTNATFYPPFVNATSGNLTTTFVSSTKLTYNPSTGTLSASALSSPSLTATATTLALGATGANSITASTNGSTRLTVDGSGNVSIGAAPSAWESGIRALQVGALGSALFQASSVSPSTFLTTNYYVDSNNRARYISSSVASNSTVYRQISGGHTWYSSPAGSPNATSSVTSGQAYTVTTLGSTTLAEWQVRFSALTVLPSVGQLITATASGPIAGSPAATVTQTITFTEVMNISSAGTTTLTSAASTTPFIAKIGAGEVARIDGSGNVGIGVVPSAWVANSRALQILTATSLSQTANGYTNLSSNSYESALDVYKYITNGFSTLHQQSVGQHRWYTAPSGTAGNTITFTQAMTLDANGNLGVGVTPAAKIDVLTTGGRVQLYPAVNVTGTRILSVNTAGAAAAPIEISGTQVLFTNGSNTPVGQFDSNGNLLLGSATSISSSSRLQVTSPNIGVDNGAGGQAIMAVTSDAFATDRGATLGLGGKNSGGQNVAFAAISGRSEGTANAGYLQLCTLNSGGTMSEHVRVDSTGRVGIGTTSFAAANYKLTVSGGYSVLNGLRISGADPANSIYQVAQIGISSDNLITFGTGVSQTERLRIDATGNSTFTGQVISTRANSTADNGGQIYLNGATGNRIDFNTNGVAAPTFTTRSAGTKIVLYPTVNASQVDYAIGVDTATLWQSVYTSAASFKWYAGTTAVGTLSGTGNFSTTGTILGSNITGYSIPDTGGTPSYVLLGTWTTGQAGYTLYINVVSHSGYNASESQNQVTKLYFKTSNGSSNQGGFYGDALAFREVPLGYNTGSPASFRIVQVSTSSYAVYGSFSSYTSGSTYQLQYPSYTTWTHSGTVVAAPTGTFLDVTPTNYANFSSFSGVVSGTQLSSSVATGTAPLTVTSTTQVTNLNSSYLQGLVPQTSGSSITANQIARADSNGYMFFSYINSSTGNSENPAVSQVIVTNGTDNYYRKSSISSFTSAVQTNASGSWGISVTGSSASVTGLTLNSSASIINPDNVTQNQLGYCNPVALFGQTDGGLYSSAYNSVWFHQIFGDFRTGQIAIRGKNNGTLQAWRRVLDSANYSASNAWTPNFTNVTASFSSPGTFTKTSGTANTWDSQVYSTEGYTTNIFVSCSAAQTNGYIMFGLNSDPTADPSYSSLDYAFYLGGDGTLSIYESNVGRGSYGTYSTTDVLTIIYDGANVSYFRNNSLLRRVARTFSTTKLYLDSSFYTLNASLTNLSYGVFPQSTTVQAGADQAIVNQNDGNAASWYGRILSKNETSDYAAFLGTYSTVAGVFCLNNALNAWKDIYINTVDGSTGGTVRMPPTVLINGNQAIHAGNYTSYVGNGTLTLAVSGTGLSGSASFTANQSGATTFTVTSNATSANTASTIVARDASNNFSAGTITAALSGNATTATTATNVSGGSVAAATGAFSTYLFTLGQVRATGWYGTPTGSSYTGLAVEMGMSGGSGYVVCYNRDTSVYGTLNIQGSGGSTLISLPATGSTISVTGSISATGSVSGTNITSGGNVTGSSASCTGNAATATALQTARSIGGTSFNGSADITPFRASTIPSTDAGVIQTSGVTYAARSASSTPQQYTYGINFEFKNATVVSGTGNYAGLLTLAPYNGTTASTGDPNYQLAFSPAAANSTAIPTLKIRAGIDATWGSWATLLNSSNYNTYAPTLTGTGASGSWGISVTGSSASCTGNAATVTTNANLTGDVTSVGNATSIAAGVIVNADINASAAIADTKLATIATAGKVSNSATTATSANTASAIVARDASGNFSAGTITATTGSFSGNMSFNSGYGSAAVAYGCRAWVNFNGTGTGTFAGGASTVTRIAGSTTATITCTTAHGLLTGSVVYVNPPLTIAGTYTVTVTSSTQFTIVTSATTAISPVTITFSLALIRASGNVSSITDNGVGDYTVNFTTAMVDANYSAVSESNTIGVYSSSFISMLSLFSQTTSSVRFSSNGDYPSGGVNDKATVCVAIFR